MPVPDRAGKGWSAIGAKASYGPHAFFEWRGYPVKVRCTEAARDEADAAALWEKSVALTGVDFGALARARAA